MSKAENCIGRIMRRDGKVHGIFVIEYEGNFIFTTSFAEMFPDGRAAVKVEGDQAFLEIPLINRTVDLFGSFQDKTELAGMLADSTIQWFAFAKPLNLMEMGLVVTRRP